MKKVWFAFLLGFLAIWSGNSMDGRKGSGKDNVPMTFVLGTDKSYIVPTLVTIHSLLKNGVKRDSNRTKINIVVLIEKLGGIDKELFRNIFDKIINTLQWKRESIGLYFIDIPQDKENEFWHGDFADVNKKLDFFGLNVQGKIMPKYKAFLPFCIKNHGNKFGYDTIGTLLPLSKLNKNAIQISPKNTSSMPRPLLPEKTVRNNNAKTRPVLLEGETKDSLEIAHYMWLDSDILINGDISNLYQECLQSEAAIGSANYWFVSKDLPSQYNINLGCTEDRVLRNIGIVENNYLSRDKGFPSILDELPKEKDKDKDKNKIYSIHKPLKINKDATTRRPWRCSGGVMFFNLGEQFISLRNLKEFLKYGLSDGWEDEETFFEQCTNEKRKVFSAIYAFSPIYNCRPSMPAAAQETLEKLTDQNGEGAKELKKITNPKEIAIWHWDGMRKPWQKLYGGFPLLGGKIENVEKRPINKSEYDDLMDADRQWIEKYAEVCNILGKVGEEADSLFADFVKNSGINP